MSEYASRAAVKLEHALQSFSLDVTNFICADFGCNAGGFTDVLLRRGAKPVYAIDTGYGMLEWRLRKDPRVVVMERTNAMHVALPAKMDLIVIDVAWTKQSKILPAALKNLASGGAVVSLVKPHYEAAARQLRAGVLRVEELPRVREQVEREIAEAGFECVAWVDSPIKGAKGNIEWLAHLRPTPA